MFSFCRYSNAAKSQSVIPNTALPSTVKSYLPEYPVYPRLEASDARPVADRISGWPYTENVFETVAVNSTP